MNDLDDKLKELETQEDMENFIKLEQKLGN